MPSLAKLPSIVKWSSLAKLPSLARLPLLSWTALCWCHCWLRWRCCPHCIRITASIALVSLTLSQWRRCLCCNGVAPPCCAGICPIMTLLAMHGSTLRVSLWCSSCPVRPCHCVAFVVIYVGRPGYAKHLANLEALLALAVHSHRARPHHRTQHRHHHKWRRHCHLRWPAQICQLPCRFGRPCLSGHFPTLSLLLPSLRWRTCPCCTGVTASIALASLPSMRWRHCPSCWLLPHCDAACNTLLLQSWRLCRHFAGILASIALATLPALR
jgi:hypothetical protein